MNAYFQAVSGLGAAVAVAEECFVVFFISAGEAQNLRADEEAFGGYVDADLFVTATDCAHKDLAGRQIDLDVQVSLLTDEILFFDADRGHDKSDTRAADVGRFTQNARWNRTVT